HILGYFYQAFLNIQHFCNYPYLSIFGIDHQITKSCTSSNPVNPDMTTPRFAIRQINTKKSGLTAY
ncbi:MAG: hypothetical protein WCO49_06500, partial [Nostocales cyanobacterium ELA608]